MANPNAFYIADSAGFTRIEDRGKLVQGADWSLPIGAMAEPSALISSQHCGLGLWAVSRLQTPVS